MNTKAQKTAKTTLSFKMISSLSEGWRSNMPYEISQVLTQGMANMLIL